MFKGRNKRQGTRQAGSKGKGAGRGQQTSHAHPNNKTSSLLPHRHGRSNKGNTGRAEMSRKVVQSKPNMAGEKHKACVQGNKAVT